MRDAKRFLIGFVYLAMVIALGVFVYFSFIKAPETCSDGKKNQNESGVDCDGVCTNACKENIIGQAFEIQEVAFVPGGEGVYDVLGKIYNPNDEIGASVFHYTFELKDQSGKVLVEREGESFILPQETKSLIELNLPFAEVPFSATLRISEIGWERFSGYQSKPTISIYQRRYDQISSGVGFGEAYGLVVNESPYDFRTISVKVVLRDASGKPLAFNMTQMNTVNAKEERDFRLVWPTAFPGVVSQVEMEADADIYHSDNFLRQYLPGGRFQNLEQ